MIIVLIILIVIFLAAVLYLYFGYRPVYERNEFTTNLAVVTNKIADPILRAELTTFAKTLLPLGGKSYFSDIEMYVYLHIFARFGGLASTDVTYTCAAATLRDLKKETAYSPLVILDVLGMKPTDANKLPPPAVSATPAVYYQSEMNVYYNISVQFKNHLYSLGVKV